MDVYKLYALSLTTKSHLPASSNDLRNVIDSMFLSTRNPTSWYHWGEYL